MPRYVTISACLLYLFFFISSLPVASQPSTSRIRLNSSPALAVTDAGGWKPIYKGIEFRKMALERSEPNQSIDLKLFRFDGQRIVPRVLRSVQFQLKGANAKTFADKSGALAVINANYFDGDGRPLAFLKVAGQAINSRVSTSSLYTGVFATREQRPFIAHRDEFSPE